MVVGTELTYTFSEWDTHTTSTTQTLRCKQWKAKKVSPIRFPVLFFLFIITRDETHIILFCIILLLDIMLSFFSVNLLLLVSVERLGHSSKWNIFSSLLKYFNKFKSWKCLMKTRSTILDNEKENFLEDITLWQSSRNDTLCHIFERRGTQHREIRQIVNLCPLLRRLFSLSFAFTYRL